ncbi:MAG: hypothetical protein PUF62_00810 [Bacteroidales bacterium]|nr:hypothetical protein [Bacteroidales bacterium]
MVLGFARLTNSLSELSGHFVSPAKPPKGQLPHFCQVAKPPKGYIPHFVTLTKPPKSLHPSFCQLTKPAKNLHPHVVTPAKAYLGLHQRYREILGSDAGQQEVFLAMSEKQQKRIQQKLTSLFNPNRSLGFGINGKRDRK